MIRILAAIPDLAHSTSFYRGMGPLNRILKDHPGKFSVTPIKEFSWDVLGQGDILFAHRAYTQSHLRVCQMAKDMGLKVIIDYDDNLFDIKPDNQRPWVKFKEPGVAAAIQEVYKLADQMWVASEALAEVYRERGVKDVRVVPNAYDKTLFPYRGSDLPRRQKTVLWRGGDSHLHDCMTVKDAYLELAKKHGDWTFLFLGSHPWWMSNELPKNVRFQMGVDYVMEYFKLLYVLSPAVAAHPLSVGRFNECKSMCSWLEATHAGAAFVGPNFKEYERDGVTMYEASNPDSFFEKMDYLISNENVRVKRVDQSWEYIGKNLELGFVNKVRLNAIADLLGVSEVSARASALSLKELA